MSIVTVNQYHEDRAKFRREVLSKIPKIQYAVVTSINQQGAPIIKFGEDSSSSQKIYPRLKSYVPVIGERIMLINGVIQGGIKI